MVDKSQVHFLVELDNYIQPEKEYRFGARYYRIAGMAPFMVVLFVNLRFFANSAGGLPIAALFASLAWALFVAIRALSF